MGDRRFSLSAFITFASARHDGEMSNGTAGSGRGGRYGRRGPPTRHVGSIRRGHKVTGTRGLSCPFLGGRCRYMPMHVYIV